MTHLIEIISIILEFFCISFIAKGFLHLPISLQKRDIIACIAITIITYFVTSQLPLGTWLIGQFLYLLYICNLKKDNFINQLLLHCLTYMSIILLEFALLYILLGHPSILQHHVMPLAGTSITLVIVLLCCHYIPLYKYYQSVVQAGFFYRIICLNCYLIFIFALFFYKLDIHHFYDILVYLIIVFLLLLLSNMIALYYNQKIRLERQKVLAYQTNLPLYQSLIDEIRASQHEFANRLQTFQQLPNVCKDYASICKALQTNTQFYAPAKNYPLLQLNMPLLAAALYHLHCQAQERNISIIFDIATKNISSQAPEYQLSDFVHILAQNALEECQSGDTIYIHITTSENAHFHFVIQNPVRKKYTHQEIALFFQKNYSTKQNLKKHNSNHGLGLYYLAKTLVDYNGTITVACDSYEDKTWMIFTLEV